MKMFHRIFAINRVNNYISKLSYKLELARNLQKISTINDFSSFVSQIKELLESKRFLNLEKRFIFWIEKSILLESYLSLHKTDKL